MKSYKKVFLSYAGGNPKVGIAASVFNAWPSTYINEIQNIVLKQIECLHNNHKRQLPMNFIY